MAAGDGEQGPLIRLSRVYGNNIIWQMWEPGREPAIFADIPWYEAMDHPGALQMGFVRRLFGSRPFQMLEPDPAMVKAGPTTGGAKVRALRATNGSLRSSIRRAGKAERWTRTRSRRASEVWYDPRYGVTRPLHSTEIGATRPMRPDFGTGQ
jgi:hypothetical protein